MSFRNLRSKTLSVAILAIAAAAPFPVAAHEAPQEEANKKVVTDFYAALRNAEATKTMQQSMRGIIETFMSADYKQHSERFQQMPGPGTARDKLIQQFSRPRPPGGSPSGPKLGPDWIVSIMGHGDLVMMLTAREFLNSPTPRKTPVYIFNMFRVKDGRLTEHWDVIPGELDMPRAPAPAPAPAPASVPAPPPVPAPPK